MRVVLLKPVTDGDGEHAIGSECTFADIEAIRLIKLGAARKVVELSVNQNTHKEDKKAKKSAENLEEGTGNSSEEEFLTEAEYAKILAELQTIDGVSLVLAEKLVEAGFQSIESVAEADAAELIEIEGIGKKSVIKLQASAKSLWTSEAEDE